MVLTLPALALDPRCANQILFQLRMGIDKGILGINMNANQGNVLGGARDLTRVSLRVYMLLERFPYVCLDSV